MEKRQHPNTTWQEVAALTIREVLDAHPKVTGSKLMDLLRANCPMDKDAHFLQKLWRKEVQVALGIARKQSRDVLRAIGETTNGYEPM